MPNEPSTISTFHVEPDYGKSLNDFAVEEVRSHLKSIANDPDGPVQSKIAVVEFRHAFFAAGGCQPVYEWLMSGLCL